MQVGTEIAAVELDLPQLIPLQVRVVDEDGMPVPRQKLKFAHVEIADGKGTFTLLGMYSDEHGIARHQATPVAPMRIYCHYKGQVNSIDLAASRDPHEVHTLRLH